jgi:hypothetical protein
VLGRSELLQAYDPHGLNNMTHSIEREWRRTFAFAPAVSRESIDSVSNPLICDVLQAQPDVVLHLEDPRRFPQLSFRCWQLSWRGCIQNVKEGAFMSSSVPPSNAVDQANRTIYLLVLLCMFVIALVSSMVR